MGAGGNRTVCGVFGILAAPALVEALSDAVVDRVAHTVELFRQADVDASCDRVQFIVRYVADRISLGVEIWELFAPADVVDEVRKGRGR